jgi:hypothetical protein
LGHEFASEVILLGVDLPPELDAPFISPSGRAIWYSMGTVVANAAAVVLQLDPGELRVGVRAVRRPDGRLHGEVFIYDDVPGGAGYARAIQANLEGVMAQALAMARHCSNRDCPGACYHCLLEYSNQRIHPLLDRRLAASILEFVLEGRRPVLSPDDILLSAAALSELAEGVWSVLPGRALPEAELPLVLRNTSGDQVGLWVTHPFETKPSAAQRQAILATHGIRIAAHNTFDLQRRPFWVLNNLLTE